MAGIARVRLVLMAAGGKRAAREDGTRKRQTAKGKTTGVDHAENGAVRCRKRPSSQNAGPAAKALPSEKSGRDVRGAFDEKPSSGTCKANAGSGLCRWEVHQFRQQLWTKEARSFFGKPATYSALVPPRRLAAFDQLDGITLENAKRKMRRILWNALPKGTARASIFDISLADGQTVKQQARYRVPHL